MSEQEECGWTSYCSDKICCFSFSQIGDSDRDGAQGLGERDVKGNSCCLTLHAWHRCLNGEDNFSWTIERLNTEDVISEIQSTYGFCSEAPLEELDTPQWFWGNLGEMPALGPWAGVKHSPSRAAAKATLYPNWQCSFLGKLPFSPQASLSAHCMTHRPRVGRLNHLSEGQSWS